MANELGVIKEGDAIFPYWGKRFSSITGLDPLGQQYASEKIYSHLLPGITNLTNRIRYYGFYCWLLKEYARINPATLSKRSQHIFIRRAELALAIIMSKMAPDVLQIPGSSKAGEIVERYKEKSKINVSQYADDPESTNSYWKYSSGAFGQYYAASLEKIGIIKGSVQDIYTITEEGDYITGKQIADSLQENVSGNVRDIFLGILESGQLFTKDINQIYESFNVVNIPIKSKEWKNYKDLLWNPDLPIRDEPVETHRRNTIDLILNLSKQENDGISNNFFLNNLFKRGLAKTETSLTTEFGWFQYRLNEFWQYACGTIFWATLNHLSNNKNGIAKESEIINDVLEEMFCLDGVYRNKIVENSLREINTNEIQSKIAAINNAERANDSSSALQHALSILLMIFAFPPKRVSSDLEVLSKNNLVTSGNFLKKMENFYANNFHSEILESFMYSFVRKEILLRHKIVALNKLGRGTRSTLKFITEGDTMLYEGNFSPIMTNPRLDALFRMLSDLNILFHTDSGNYLLNSQYSN